MSENELEQMFMLDMKEALRRATEKKWLGKERHGYCFSCGKETLVFDIIAEGSPVQPPKCENCFIDSAIAFLESPKAKKLIEEIQNYGFEESE